MAKVETVSTRNEAGDEVILHRTKADEVAKDLASGEPATGGDGEVLYTIGDTNQTVTRIGLGKYRVDETGETLMEP